MTPLVIDDRDANRGPASRGPGPITVSGFDYLTCSLKVLLLEDPRYFVGSPR
jgi:hypothetical protein